MPGTPNAGFMKAVPGGFKCANCKHLKPNGCDEDEVIEDLGKNQYGLATVEPEDCCNEFDPKGQQQKFRGRVK